MKALLAGALLGSLALLACSSIQKAKRPDESRRIPVNNVLPPELEGRAQGRPPKDEPVDPAEVEWR